MRQKTAEPLASPDDSELKVDFAYRQLEEMMVTRVLPPGSVVSEVQLAAQLNVGRTPVREALARLKQIGFVETLPRRGTLVANVDVRKQLELLEVRRPLEILITSCASVRATAAQRAEMKTVAGQLQSAARRRDLRQYFKVNRAMHELEVASAQNSMLAATMQMIHAQSRRFWYENFSTAAVFEEGCACHVAILKAIAAGAPNDAAAAVDDLMKHLEGLTRSALDAFR